MKCARQLVIKNNNLADDTTNKQAILLYFGA
jgi:hypothetical protein